MTESSALVRGVTVPTLHLIDGRRVEGGEPIAVHSPADGSLLGHVPNGAETEVAAAVDAARGAFPAWAALGADGRGDLLDRFAAAILDRTNDLADVDAADNGGLAGMARHAMVPRSSQNIKFFSDWARRLHGEVIEGPLVDNVVRYEPAGVAALIVPWNAP